MYADNLGDLGFSLKKFRKKAKKGIGKVVKKVAKGAMKAVSMIAPGGGMPEESYESESAPMQAQSTFPWIYIIGGVGILVVGAIIYKSRQE